MADFSEAIRFNPAYTAAFYHRGLAYSWQAQYEAGVADFSEVIRLNPVDASVFYNRGLAYFLQGQYEAAVSDFSEATRLNPAYIAAFYNIARVYARQGQVEAVLPPLRRVLELALEKGLTTLSTDPAFDLIRTDSRIQALLAEFAPQPNPSTPPNREDEELDVGLS